MCVSNSTEPWEGPLLASRPSLQKSAEPFPTRQQELMAETQLCILQLGILSAEFDSIDWLL